MKTLLKWTTYTTLVIFSAVFIISRSSGKNLNKADDDLSGFSQKLYELTMAASAKQDDQSVVLYVNTFYRAYDNSSNKVALAKYKAWFDILKTSQPQKLYTIGLSGMSGTLKIGSFTNEIMKMQGH